jgi:hypothetical protein
MRSLSLKFQESLRHRLTCARYSLSGKEDFGYSMLHRAINIAESMGLVGQSGSNLIPGHISSDMEESLERTAWGLFHIDT